MPSNKTTQLSKDEIQASKVKMKSLVKQAQQDPAGLQKELDKMFPGSQEEPDDKPQPLISRPLPKPKP
jgi:hypothetical protein